MSLANLDSLLDVTLDDLADLPSFTPYAPGVHRVKASFEAKEINDKAAIELSFVMIENEELVNPEDKAPVAGDTSNTMFMLDNEYGQGNFKKCALPFAEALNLSTMREVSELKDIECMIVTGVRAAKNDATTLYLVVKEIAII